MAIGKSILAAAAYVELSMRKEKFDRDLNSMSAKYRRFVSGMSRMGTGFLVMGAAITAPFTLFIRDASDAIELADRFDQVFRDNLANATEYAEDFANSFNRALSEVQAMMNGIGAKFAQMEPDKFIAFTKAMTEFAYDFGSAMNLTDAEAMRRTVGALSGEAENLDRFGINIRDQKLNEVFRELEELGLGYEGITTRTASMLQKITARSYAMIQQSKQLGIEGDLARTFDKPAAVFRQFSSLLKEVREEAGNAVVGDVAGLTRVLLGLLKASRDFIKDNPKVLSSIFNFGAALVVIGGGLKTLAILGKALFKFLSIKTILVALKALFAGLIRTMVMNPIGMIITGLVLVLGKATGAMDTFLNSFDRATAAFAANWQTVVNFIASGDLSMAWESLLLTLKLSWQEFYIGIVSDLNNWINSWSAMPIPFAQDGWFANFTKDLKSAKGETEQRLKELALEAADARKKMNTELALSMFEDPGGVDAAAKKGRANRARNMGTASTQIANLLGFGGMRKNGDGVGWKTKQTEQAKKNAEEFRKVQEKQWREQNQDLVRKIQIMLNTFPLGSI